MPWAERDLSLVELHQLTIFILSWSSIVVQLYFLLVFLCGQVVFIKDV